MVKKKTKASVIVQFRWKEEFLEMVKNDALKNGVPLGSYLAMLASQKHIENEAMRMVGTFSDEKLQEAVDKIMRGELGR